MDSLPDHSWASTPLFVPFRYRAPASGGEVNFLPPGYLAFAHDLIAATRPKLLVQISTAPDELYFASCQSVDQLGLDTLCYALHSGAADDEGTARDYNESQYAHFSHLLRMDEGQAAELSQFAEGSIDLLYLQAGPSYEAARIAFRSSRLKLRPGAIVLIPGIDRREAGFGLWKLWAEIEAEFPRTFTFHEGGGLGIVQIPGTAEITSTRPLLSSLFAGSPTEAEMVRRYYMFYTAYLRSRLQPESDRTLLLELQTAQAERMLAIADLKQVVEQRNAARREIYQLEHDLQAQKAHSAQLDIDVANWKQMGEYERNIREQILTSLSWKLTTPLRLGVAWVRKLRGSG